MAENRQDGCSAADRRDMPNVTRRQLLAAVGGAAATFALGAAPAPGGRVGVADAPRPNSTDSPGSRDRPNIVLIFADDLGWGELGSYGQQIIATPNLDRMAAEGVRFTDAYSAAPICAPSRCSLFTGRHQGHAAVRHNTFNESPPRVQADLDPDHPTFAELLKAAGYATGLFGKWGFGPDNRAPSAVESEVPNEGHFSHPLQRGFDEFNGFVYHSNSTRGYWADYWWEGNQRIDIEANADGAQGQYMPDLYVDRALDFIRRQAAARTPFALTLCSQLPHTPNHVPDWSQYDDLPFPTDTKKHAAMVSWLDMHVGMVLDALEQSGLADNTLVIFTSDNGPHNETAVYGGTDPIPGFGVTSVADEVIFNANGPFRGVKQNLYEGGIRMPTLAWGPGVLGTQVQGTVSDHACATYDLLATFADFADGAVPGPTDGISLRPLLEGRRAEQRQHEYLYWERFLAGAPTPMYIANDRGRHGNFVQAVRKGDWKLLRWAPGTHRDGSIDINPTGFRPDAPSVPGVQVPRDYWEVELYDLAADPSETTDLAWLQPDVVDELTAHMEQAHVAPADV